jgi:hypothetical protein
MPFRFSEIYNWSVFLQNVTNEQKCLNDGNETLSYVISIVYLGTHLGLRLKKVGLQFFLLNFEALSASAVIYWVWYAYRLYGISEAFPA